MAERLRVIVTGLIAQHPLGGVTWDYIQYPVGLARLGHDVTYLEDSGEWPYRDGDASESFDVPDCSLNAAYLAEVMERFGLGDRWAYRCPIDGVWHGLSDAKRTEVRQTADLLINVSGTLARPEDYRSVRRLVYVDSDPVFTQIKLARGLADFRRLVNAHHVFMSFGECLGDPLPDTGHHWIATRQPILLDAWRPGGPRREVFTTVMNWASYNPVSFRGRTFAQKNIEFRKFIELPRHVAPTTLELAVRGAKRRRIPRDLITTLSEIGWQVVDPSQVCPDVDRYRDYVETSKGEWSVAKNGYVEGQPGWFSCRSACYLAAGRPVVVQDTGFQPAIPAGEGVIAFRTLDEAAAGLREIEAHYDRHAAAARAIAEAYFDSDRVLGRLIEDAMNAPVLVGELRP